MRFFLKCCSLLILNLMPLITSQRLPKQIYEGCGTEKGCFGGPGNCIEQQACDMVATYKVVESQIIFELQTHPRAGLDTPKYVASALSTDTTMGDDSVIECVEENGEIKAYAAWTTPRLNPRLNSIRENVPQYIIRLIDTSYNDGLIYCQVAKDASHIIHDNHFDVISTPYHLFIASGSSLRENGISRHNLGHHYSIDLLNFNEYSINDPTEDTPEITDPTQQPDYSIYEDCGRLKTCFGYPNNCIFTKRCLYVGAYYSVGYQMHYEMQTMTGQSLYIATGISDDHRMGEDLITECVYQNGDIRAFASWTTPSIMKASAAVREGVIQNTTILIGKSFVNGDIYCKVATNIVNIVHGKEFNVNTEKYYFMVATGSLIAENAIEEHDLGRIISDRAMDLTEITISVAMPARSDLIKIHAAFMIVAWIGTGSCGMIIARYYKRTWIGQQINRKDLWFSWHVMLMCSTWILHIVAFITIFVYVYGWSRIENPHAILGVVSTVFLFFQPIGGLFRPSINEKARPIFNVIHWFGGTTAQTVAFVTMFFAVALPKAQLPEVFYWILAGFIAATILAHTILTASYYFASQSDSKELSDKDDSHSLLRKIVLTFYVIISLAASVALIVLATT